eukprot:s5992_g2.t1
MSFSEQEFLVTQWACWPQALAEKVRRLRSVPVALWNRDPGFVALEEFGVQVECLTLETPVGLRSYLIWRCASHAVVFKGRLRGAAYAEPALFGATAISSGCLLLWYGACFVAFCYWDASKKPNTAGRRPARRVVVRYIDADPWYTQTGTAWEGRSLMTAFPDPSFNRPLRLVAAHGQAFVRRSFIAMYRALLREVVVVETFALDCVLFGLELAAYDFSGDDQFTAA